MLSVHIFQNGLSAASGSADKTVKTWNLRKFKQVFEILRTY